MGKIIFIKIRQKRVQALNGIKINLFGHISYILYQVKINIISQNNGLLILIFFSIFTLGQAKITKSNCNSECSWWQPIVLHQPAVGHLSWWLAVSGTFRNSNTCLSLHPEFEFTSPSNITKCHWIKGIIMSNYCIKKEKINDKCFHSYRSERNRVCWDVSQHKDGTDAVNILRSNLSKQLG